MRVFPCPICKGRGYWPGETMDVGDSEVGSLMIQIAPNDDCGYCEGEGMIEIGSELHKRIKRWNIKRDIWLAFGNTNPAYEYPLETDGRLEQLIVQAQELLERKAS